MVRDPLKDGRAQELKVHLNYSKPCHYQRLWDIKMAESGVSPNGQLPRSHDRRGTIGIAPRKGKKVTNSASEPEMNPSWGFSGNYPGSCQRMPGPNVLALQPSQRLEKANSSAGRAANQQSENRGCPEPGKPGDSIPSGVGQRDRCQEGELPPCLQKRTLRREMGPPEGGKNALRKCTTQGELRGAAEIVNSENLPPRNSSAKNWSPPKGFWKVLGSESAMSRDRADPFNNQILQKETWNANGPDHPNVDYSNGSGPAQKLTRADSFDSSGLRYGECTAENWNARKLSHLEGLWRTDSWESVSSNASLLSLTERVELNRSILKRTLRSAPLQPGSDGESLPQEKHVAPGCQFQPGILDDILPGNTCIKQVCGAEQSDSDWDSGISLQESNRGMRVFVSSSQLPLSRRHEQAKRLLERARMKARASPLKADHSIRPIERSHLETNINDTSSPKKGPFSRDGFSSNLHNNGNLSDSSSGESHCRLQTKRSQSPSRVRFEDESTQEAEVRYQLRRKCGIEYSVRRGPRGLLPKPGLPAYGLPRKECLLKAGSGDVSRPYCKNTQGQMAWRGGSNPVTSGEKVTYRANIPQVNTAICIDGKCSSCGSYIISDSKAGSYEPPSYKFPDVRIIPQDKELHLPNQHELPQDTALGLKTNLTVDTGDVGSFTPRAIPCWVLPSEHRVRIEPIKETYIGDVTSIDDISVIDGGAASVSCQDNVTERTGTQVSAYYYTIVSGKVGRTTDSLEPNAKDIDCPWGSTGEDSVTFEPVSTTADCKSKSRRKIMEKGGDYAQQIHCQREGPVESRQELRSSADPKAVVSVCVSKDSHGANPSSGQVPEISSGLQPTPHSPTQMSHQNSRQSRESSTVHSPVIPQRKGQVKENPPSLHSQDRSRVLNSHLTDPQFIDETSCQQPLLKRPMINKANLTILSTAHQTRIPVTLRSQPVTHLDACPSPQYRLVHLDPSDDGRPAVPETSSLQPLQPMPNDNSVALCASEIPAHCPSNPAIRLPRSTVTNGTGQSSGNCRSEVRVRNSQVANKLIKPNGRLSHSEHHDAISASAETISSLEEEARKQNETTESHTTMVKAQLQDNATCQEDPAPDSGEHRRLARPPGLGPNASEPEARAGGCGEGPSQHPASGPSEGHRVPVVAESQSGARHSPKSHLKSSSSLKALFSTIRHSTVSKLNRLRSSSLEQINSRSADSTSGGLRCEEIQATLRKTPSLQSLRLVSPLAQLRKTASFQSLHFLQKKNRYSSYVVREAAETSLGHSEVKPTGHRSITSLSVEDTRLPNHPRVIGQVTQTFADASFILELSKPAHGSFGFLISRSRGRLFIHQMADQYAEKLYAGLLELGDEILEVNREPVEGLSFNEVNTLMLQDSTVSLWIRRHNGTREQHEE
ncbi:uncharacterized protein KIAA1614-like isoform X2 [Scyliorhinus canicula]|uniref:uncharacterized protein KIAA1614-like isoform X2 n=1 Tax=Scyliorhinus canicula TaxID=7830 RepID=UPI0018F76B9A|nr:uncharacterized protein KIAA1614-like isoform X2 [Scyliorhinus canicula]